ncbi:hypothetical protein [Streptomyces sp. NPDC001492]
MAASGLRGDDGVPRIRERASVRIGRLGDRAAGSYYDAASRCIVVDVTDRSATRQVQAAGVVPRVVPSCMAQLHSTAATSAEPAHRSEAHPGRGVPAGRRLRRPTG